MIAKFEFSLVVPAVLVIAAGILFSCGPDRTEGNYGDKKWTQTLWDDVHSDKGGSRSGHGMRDD